MPETYKKVSAGYLEAKSLQLSKQFRQAIDNGEVFWNVKKIYLKLKRVQKQLASSVSIEESANV